MDVEILLCKGGDTSGGQRKNVTGAPLWRWKMAGGSQSAPTPPPGPPYPPPPPLFSMEARAEGGIGGRAGGFPLRTAGCPSLIDKGAHLCKRQLHSGSVLEAK